MYSCCQLLTAARYRLLQALYWLQSKPWYIPVITPLPAPQARTFEGSGLPRPMAEQLAQRITELIVMNKMKMEETFVKQVLLEKVCNRTVPWQVFAWASLGARARPPRPSWFQPERVRLPVKLLFCSRTGVQSSRLRSSLGTLQPYASHLLTFPPALLCPCPSRRFWSKRLRS